MPKNKNNLRTVVRLKMFKKFFFSFDFLFVYIAVLLIQQKQFSQHYEVIQICNIILYCMMDYKNIRDVVDNENLVNKMYL